MQVTVDINMCASTGSCERISPEVFQLGTDGVVVVLQQSPAEPLHQAVLDAAEMCPTACISVEN